MSEETDFIEEHYSPSTEVGKALKDKMLEMVDETAPTVRVDGDAPTARLWEQADLLSELEALDFIKMIDKEMGHWFLHFDGKFRRTAREVLAHDVPWIFVRPQMGDQCDVELLFMEHCGFISPVCMNCYKVVVRPRKIEDLLKLLWIQENKTNRPCKCGTEERASVPAGYGGYFYNKGLSEGLDCYDEVRALVDEHIGPHVGVILKRACTEIEAKYGPSDMWPEPDEGQLALYEQIRAMFDVPDNVPSPPIMKIHTVNRWLHWANSAVDDRTCEKFNEGKPFRPPYVIYTRPKEGGDNGDIDKKETSRQG